MFRSVCHVGGGGGVICHCFGSILMLSRIERWYRSCLCVVVVVREYRMGVGWLNGIFEGLLGVCGWLVGWEKICCKFCVVDVLFLGMLLWN